MLGSLSYMTLTAMIFVALLTARSRAQQPIDLFPDNAPLDTGFIRIGSWNLRHISLENGAGEFLPGATEAEDFAILTATFAKAIKDLGLDLIAVVEHQPRSGEPNRLLQIRDHLNNGATGPWKADETNIDYDDSSDPFGNLQFGILWNSSRVSINTNADTLLVDLRQPRNQNGVLTERKMRIPWLIPVQAGSLSFDLLVLHLKSGGDFPQADEVNAIQRFITQGQAAPSPRHLIVCGDWNIRPDQSTGRTRLRQMLAPGPSGDLMRVLTPGEVRPTLDEWETLGAVQFGSPIAGLIPFSHYNTTTFDTFLDHMAISLTLEEVFDNPIQVRLANGASDLRPGIRVAVPLIPKENYLKITDHLPLVLILRTTAPQPITGGPTPGLRIVGAVPNPVTDDAQDEEVRVKNTGSQPVSLDGWKLGDSTGVDFWILASQDGVIQPGMTVVVRRKGRPMALNNSGGDTIVLINPTGTVVDQKSYGNAPSGKVFTFN